MIVVIPTEAALGRVEESLLFLIKGSLHYAFARGGHVAPVEMTNNFIFLYF